MTKLTNEQLEILVNKRNQLGLQHTVEVMNNNELAAYKINCTEAIQRLDKQINKSKTGGTMQQILIENKEVLEGYIVYIDNKLNNKLEQNGEDIIDFFLAYWREKAYHVYTELRKEYDSIRSDFHKRIKFMNEISKLDNQIITHSAFERNLNDFLNFEVKKKKMLLLQRITKKAGNIINTNELKLGDNGEINGTIIGDKATVNIRTIYAGGHSIQCLHYRVLVKEIK